MGKKAEQIVEQTVMQHVAELEGRLRIANRLYYDDPDNCTLSDKAFDALYAELKQVFPASPVLQERSNYDRDIQHTRLVGSWDKVHSAAEVAKRFGSKQVHLSPKIDGASLTLYYEDGRLVLGATRGDSTTGKGKDITANVLMIEGVPWFIPEMGKVEVKGEAYIPKSKFYGIMDQPGYGGKPKGLANPRNAAAGGIMAKNPNETADRKVHFVAYGYRTEDTNAAPDTLHECFYALKALGFTVPHSIVTKCDEGLLQPLIEKIANDATEFEIDGVVVVLDIIAEFEALGVSGICPQGGVAYKFETATAITELLDIEWTALRTGKVRPRGRVKPVTLNGSTIEFLTLNNVTWLREQDLCINDDIEIKKANEIIPTLVRVVARPRSRLLNIPTDCPSCGSKLGQDGADLYCLNDECPAKVTEAARHMLVKLDIKGIGPEFIEKMADGGLLNEAIDIFDVTVEGLVKAGFGAGQAKNIVAALKDVEVSEAQQLAALGIEFWGRSMFTTLFRDSTITYDELLQAHTEPAWEALLKRLSSVPMIGPNRAAALISGLRAKRPMWGRLRAHTTLKAEKLPAVAAANGHPWNGKTFCVTGTLSRPRGEIHAEIMKCGGTPVDSVNKTTSFLVVGDKAGSKLAKAQKLGVATMTEAEFWERVKG